DVGDAGRVAAGAARRRVVSVLVDVPARGAAHPGAHVLRTEVDGVDLDRVPTCVEGGTGREVTQRVRRTTRDRERFVAVLLRLGVDPGQGDLEHDRVVEQRVVGEQPERLEGGHPVLAAQLT